MDHSDTIRKLNAAEAAAEAAEKAAADARAAAETATAAQVGSDDAVLLYTGCRTNMVWHASSAVEIELQLRSMRLRCLPRD